MYDTVNEWKGEFFVDIISFTQYLVGSCTGTEDRVALFWLGVNFGLFKNPIATLK